MEKLTKYFVHPVESLNYSTIGQRIASCIKTTNNANPTSYKGWRAEEELQYWIDKVDPQLAIQVYLRAREIASQKPHNYEYFGENNIK